VGPGDVGLTPAPPEAIAAGSPDQNAATTRAILEGQSGPARGLALFNAGAAIYAAGRATTLAEGVQVAGEALDSGAARRTTEAFVARTRELAGA
jgi:anthranilate phosphoribosyltransferase